MLQGGRGRAHHGAPVTFLEPWSEDEVGGGGGECWSMSGGQRLRNSSMFFRGRGMGCEHTDWTFILGEGMPEHIGEKSTDAWQKEEISLIWGPKSRPGCSRGQRDSRSGWVQGFSTLRWHQNHLRVLFTHMESGFHIIHGFWLGWLGLGLEICIWATQEVPMHAVKRWCQTQRKPGSLAKVKKKPCWLPPEWGPQSTHWN